MVHVLDRYVRSFYVCFNLFKVFLLVILVSGRCRLTRLLSVSGFFHFLQNH